MLNIVRDIHSLSSFKRNTSKFIQLMKETGQPVVLTVNGKAEKLPKIPQPIWKRDFW